MQPQLPFAQLDQPFARLDEWAGYFENALIPIQTDTSLGLEALRVNEDAVDANALGELVSADPLMTLKLLIHASLSRPLERPTETETVTSSLVMMGIAPFFRVFGRQPTVEEHLQDCGDALEGLERVLRRAHRAAAFALAFAVHRMDHDAVVLHEAALVHDFPEMLLWCHAPALALRIQRAQADDPALRSSAAQRAALNIELDDLRPALMRRWRLPSLLVTALDDKHARHPSARSVMLAMQLARHTTQGWTNPALPDDVQAVAELLNLSHGHALAFVRSVDF